MTKNDCDIVKDLIPNYMEKQVSKSTKEFIEEHIKTCNTCRNLLEELKKEEKEEKNNEEIEESLKIDYLKKYNKKIKLLKTIEILIALIIIFIWIYIFAKNLYITNHYEYAHNIISTVYEKTKNLKEKEKNFSIVTTYSYGSKREFYYKDGKYKEDNIYNYSNDDGISGYINYGVETEEGDSLVVQLQRNGNKIFDTGTTMKVLSTDGKNIDTNPIKKVFFLESFYKMGKKESLSLEIREDKDNEKECIVVRNKINNSEYEEIWIDKEEMLVIKDINNTLDNTWQESYIWQVGNVTDEDVSIKNQNIDQIETQRSQMYYEVMDLLQN